MYIILAVIVMALVFAIWLFSNSFLSIKVSPRDAMVFVDEEQVSVNSFGFAKKRLSLGSHLVKVEMDGYVSTIKSVDLKRGMTKSQNITLKENPFVTTIAENGNFLAKGNNPDEFFYLGNNGSAIYRTKIGLDDKGEITQTTLPATNSNLGGIDEIIWSPNKDLALFRKSDGVYMFDFKKYDFVNQTETLWGENISSVAWSPDNSKIAYYKADEKTLIFSNLDNSQPIRIANLGDMGITDPILRWSPDSEWLALIPRNDNKTNNKIYLLNAYSKTIKQLTSSGNKVDAVFSPDNKIFYSENSRDTAGQLVTTISTINTDGEGDMALTLNTETKDILFLDNGDNILAAGEDGQSQLESIFKFDVKNNRQNDFSIHFEENEPINSLFTAINNGVAVFETESGIFGVKIN